MKEIILKVLYDIACGNTGSCQINLQSKSAQEMIAVKLEKELNKHVQELVEDIVLGTYYKDV
jgi:hypothetical protein